MYDRLKKMEKHLHKKATFSSDGHLFAYINDEDNLLIYETASSKLINDNLVWKVNGCSSICWISKPCIHVRHLENFFEHFNN